MQLESLEVHRSDTVVSSRGDVVHPQIVCLPEYLNLRQNMDQCKAVMTTGTLVRTSRTIRLVCLFFTFFLFDLQLLTCQLLATS